MHHSWVRHVNGLEQELSSQTGAVDKSIRPGNRADWSGGSKKTSNEMIVFENGLRMYQQQHTYE